MRRGIITYGYLTSTRSWLCGSDILGSIFKDGYNVVVGLV